MSAGAPQIDLAVDVTPTLVYDARIFGYCSVVAFAWTLYEHCIIFWDEYRYVWRAPWNFYKFLYIWLRLFGTGVLAVNVAVSMTDGHSARFCTAYFYWGGNVGSALLWTVEVILQLRIYAIYDKSKMLARLNAGIFVLEIVYLLVVYNLAIGTGSVLATPKGLGGCYGILRSYLFSTWLPCLTNEMWLASLAMFKAFRHYKDGLTVRGIRMDLFSVLLWDHVFYFIWLALGLLTNLIICVASPGALASAAVPISHATMVIAGTRLLLNLRIAFYQQVHDGRSTDAALAWPASALAPRRRVRRDLWSLDTSLREDASAPEDLAGEDGELDEVVETVHYTMFPDEE